jgi:tetratricopeptide (TPR) repeat protein
VAKATSNLSIAVVVLALCATTAISQSADKESEVRQNLAMVQRVEAALQPQAAGFDDELFVAARTVQDHFNDPLRALRLYERIIAEYPNSRLALAASRRAAILQNVTDGGAVNVAYAQAFVSLQQASDSLDSADVFQRGETLVHAIWPGAGDVSLWLGEYAQRRGLLAKARDYFAYTRKHWPSGRQNAIALHAQASVSVEMQDYDAALVLAAAMDVTDGADAVLQQGIISDARRGLRFRWWLTPAVAAVIGSLLVLLGSWWSARRRVSVGLRASLMPTLEVWFLAPVLALFTVASLTANVAIAPAVGLVSGYGLIAAWLAGIAFRQALATSARPPRGRAAIHCVACIIGTAGIIYVALMRQGLLISMMETLAISNE